mgnify:CR=1 FL=1
MKHNRMIHALLAAAVAAGLVLPASAAGTSSFSDVTDPATAVNADILRLMGVADGTGGNRFNPGQKLTRAQFCTMVVTSWGWGTMWSSTPPAPSSPTSPPATGPGDM